MIRIVSTAFLAIFLIVGNPFLFKAWSLNEAKLGEKLAKEVEKEFPLSKDPVEVSRVEAVGYNLVRFSSRKDIRYRFKVIAKKDINAFSLPGGYVYMFKGMLNFVRTESELAAVLAHEVAHIEYKHALRQMANAQRVTIYALIIAAATRTGAGIIGADLLRLAILNKYSRKYEEEADRRSIKLMMRAGYDPVAALTLMERLCALSQRKPPRDYGIMMDHPTLMERAKYILKELKSLGVEINRRKAANYLPVIVGKNGLDVYLGKTLLFSASSPSEAKEFAKKLVKALRINLEPFQIVVKGDRLLVSGNTVLKGRKKELEAVREKLIKILLDFRVKYMPF